MLFGDVGVVTCLPRFTLSAGVKCGADADVVPVGSLPMCSPRSCCVPPQVSGGSRSAKKGNGTYTCDRGYTIAGLAIFTRKFTRNCLFDGSFSQTGLACFPRPGGLPPLAHSASCPDVAVVYGQSVTHTCPSGYAINPKDVSAITSQLSCEENDFEPSAPEYCSPVVCNEPEFEYVERYTVSVACHEEDS